MKRQSHFCRPKSFYPSDEASLVPLLGVGDLDHGLVDDGAGARRPPQHQTEITSKRRWVTALPQVVGEVILK